MANRYDYANKPPILYETEEEEKEAIALGIKQVFTWEYAQYSPVIGIEEDKTRHVYQDEYKDLLLKAIPWKKVRLQFIKPKLNLYL